MFEAEARQPENHINNYYIGKIVWKLKTILLIFIKTITASALCS